MKLDELADDSWPPPNLPLLGNALQQTGWAGAPVTAGNWRSTVAEKLRTLDWQQARSDLAPFLERKQDLALVSEDALLALLGGCTG